MRMCDILSQAIKFSERRLAAWFAVRRLNLGARRSFLLCDFFKPLIQDDIYIKNGRSVAMYWVQPTCCRLLKMRVP